MNSSKVNIFFSTLNAILVFAGYQFMAVVFGFIFNSTNSQTISIAYRLFAFAVCVIVIFLNLGRKVVVDRPSKALILFWILALCRFMYDMFIRTDVGIPSDYKYRTGFFMVVINMIPIISLILSFNSIALDKTLRYVYFFLSVATLLSFFLNESMQITDEYARNDTMGLGSIGTGHLGLSTLVLSIYLLINKRKRFGRSFLFLLIAVVSLLVMLRSGSRGPILSLIFVLGFVLAGKSRYPILFIIIVVVVVLLSDYIMTAFLNVLNSIAPNLSRRFIFHEEGQLGGRETLYQFAWKAFVQSPFIGKYFAIYTNYDVYDVIIYPHNLFLDALMQLGIIGFSLMAFVVIKTCREVLKMIKYKSSLVWIGLIYLQFLAELMVSSAYYLTPVFSLSTILLLMFSKYGFGGQLQNEYLKE